MGRATLIGFLAEVMRALPALERTVWPESAVKWLAVAGLGLMPVGGAFYAWDHGVKRGNIQVLGAARYAAPLLSTLVLIMFCFADPTWRIVAACLLITAGVALAAKNLFLRRMDGAVAAGGGAR